MKTLKTKAAHVRSKKSAIVSPLVIEPLPQGDYPQLALANIDLNRWWQRQHYAPASWLFLP
ncbi:hypothetical protein [Dyadobacter sp. 676]|uniref:Uncharacterized protein n=1 Tax=Dyadobacter sp. 676 TaxID=3088362 RepID=A0AAU8FI47_9BACT